jgi:hypothetical protein
MRKLSRLSFGAILLGCGIVTSAILFSTRGAPVFGAQGEQPVAWPTALLQINPPRSGAIEGGKLLSADDIQRDLRTQMELLRSRRVIDRVLSQPEIHKLLSAKSQNGAAFWLARNLQITNPDGTSLLRVTLTERSGATREEQAQVINAVVDAYRVFQGGEREMRQRIIELWDHELRQREKDLDVVKQSLRKSIEAAGSRREPRDVQSQHLLDLKRKHTEISLDQTAAEVALGRHKAVAEEKSRLEERIAILTAQQKVLREETDRINANLRDSAVYDIDEEEARERIHRVSDNAEKFESYIQRLRFETSPGEERIIIVDAAQAR